MNRNCRCLLKTLALTLLPVAGMGADQVSTTGNQFSLIPQGARESAMGGNNSAFADGAFGVFGNPAATAVLPGSDISLSQLFWFTDTNYETAAFAQTLDQIGTVGVGLSLYWVPSFDNTGGLENAFSSTSYEAIVSYSTPIGSWGLKGLSFGASARYIADTFGSMAQTSDIAVDLGAYYQTNWKPLRLGLSFKNIDLVPSTMNSVPFFYGLGFALNQDHWLLTGELTQTAGQNTQLQAGGEYWVGKFLALRAGCRSQSTSGSYFEPSLGVGLKIDSNARFDYAVASYGDLGLVHWIALGLSWEPAKPTPTPTPLQPVTVVSPPLPTPTPKIIYIVKVIKTRVTPLPTPKVTPKVAAADVPVKPAETPGFPLRGSVTLNNTVHLAWDAQATVTGPSLGYNVYVSMVEGAGFKKVTDKPITQTQWSEQAGLHGIVFYYQVKAVDSQGVETLSSEIRNINVP